MKHSLPILPKSYKVKIKIFDHKLYYDKNDMIRSQSMEAFEKGINDFLDKLPQDSFFDLDLKIQDQQNDSATAHPIVLIKYYIIKE